MAKKTTKKVRPSYTTLSIANSVMQDKIVSLELRLLDAEESASNARQAFNDHFNATAKLRADCINLRIQRDNAREKAVTFYRIIRRLLGTGAPQGTPQ